MSEKQLKVTIIIFTIIFGLSALEGSYFIMIGSKPRWFFIYGTIMNSLGALIGIAGLVLKRYIIKWKKSKKG